jgi:hypothetical protein
MKSILDSQIGLASQKKPALAKAIILAVRSRSFHEDRGHNEDFGARDGQRHHKN